MNQLIGHLFWWKLLEKDEITGYYFMKIFSDKMPDLNWESEKSNKK